MRISSVWLTGSVLVGSSLCAACANTHRDFGSPDASDSGGTTTGDSGSGGQVSAAGGEAGMVGSTGGTAVTSGGAAGGDAGATSSAGSAAGGMAGALSSGGTGGTGGTGGSTVTCTGTLSACSNACVNLTGDGKNCGSCSHDCLGGSCDLGTCQAVTIATGQGTLSGIAADGTNVFWTGTSAGAHFVSRRHADLSDTTRVLAGAEAGGTGLAFSATSLYWVAAGHVRVCNLPNCTSNPADFIATVGQASCGSSMALAGGKLYWSCYSTYNVDNGVMYSLAVPLAVTTPAVMPGTNPSNPVAITSDATNVYWLNSSTYTADMTNYDGAVMRAHLSDGATASLVTLLKGDLYALAVSGNALYFSGNIDTGATGFTQAVLKVPLPNGLGGTTPPKFANGASVQGIVADSNNVYFTQANAGVVSRCAAAGCTTPDVIAPGQGSPTAMAQDAVSIYWINYSGSVMRLAK